MSQEPRLGEFLRLCMKPDQEGALALLDQHSDWLEKGLEGIYSKGRHMYKDSTAISLRLWEAAQGSSMPF